MNPHSIGKDDTHPFRNTFERRRGQSLSCKDMVKFSTITENSRAFHRLKIRKLTRKVPLLTESHLVLHNVLSPHIKIILVETTVGPVVHLYHQTP